MCPLAWSRCIGSAHWRHLEQPFLLVSVNIRRSRRSRRTRSHLAFAKSIGPHVASSVPNHRPCILHSHSGSILCTCKHLLNQSINQTDQIHSYYGDKTHNGICFSSARIALSGCNSYLARNLSSTLTEISSKGLPQPNKSPSLYCEWKWSEIIGKKFAWFARRRVYSIMQQKCVLSGNATNIAMSKQNSNAINPTSIFALQWQSNVQQINYQLTHQTQDHRTNDLFNCKQNVNSRYSTDRDNNTIQFSAARSKILRQRCHMDAHKRH